VLLIADIFDANSGLFDHLWTSNVEMNALVHFLLIFIGKIG